MNYNFPLTAPYGSLVINSSHLIICSKSGKGRTRSSLFLSILALYFLTKLSLNNAFYFFNHITFHFSHHDFNYCHGFPFFVTRPFLSSIYLFCSYLTASRSNMGHLGEESLSLASMTLFNHFGPKDHRQPCNKVGSLCLAKHLIEFEPTSSLF